jgi:hypothetical protein
MIMRRFLAVSVGLAALTIVLAIHAQDAPKGQSGIPQIMSDKGGQPTINTGSLAKAEKDLSEKYSAFQKALLTLQQRLANSPDDKDKARAAQLQKVLEVGDQHDIGAKFIQLVNFLSTQKLINTAEIDEAVRQSVMLARDLKELLDLLRNDNGAANKKEERLALEAILKKLEAVIRDERLVRSQIPINPDKQAIAKDQKDVAQKTADLESKFGDKGGEGRDPKDMKGVAKEAGKGGKAEGKDLGKESEAAKAGDAKDPGKEGGEVKVAEKHDGQGEPKNGKGGAKKGSDVAKAGEGKGDKGSDAGKAGEDKEAKGTDTAQSGKAKEPDPDKQNGAKSAEKQPSDQPAGEKQVATAKKSKGDEAKAGGAKAGDSPKAPSQAKASSQQGESKPGGDSKQGASKSNGEPSDQPPQAADGKSDNQPAPKGASSDPKDGMSNARKRIQEAQEHMDRVTDEIAKGKRDPAGQEADQAVEKLEAARRKLEELLRQLREEELERVLAALISRCQKMLAMQEEVLRGTLRVQAQIETNPSNKADRDNVLASLNLSDDELKIVQEATKAIEILETEGSAIAFPEVFQQVREDMKHVQRRLKNTDVGDVTVTIEQDIVETLKEMIKALEKAKKDMDNKKNDPKKDDSPPQPPQDQKLLDKIAELKMIKAMQLRVNARTELYGKRYQGEQAVTEDIRVELRELAGRQERIFDVTNKMAKGDGQ